VYFFLSLLLLSCVDQASCLHDPVSGTGECEGNAARLEHEACEKET
jgi:hypothetical protein